MSRLRIALLALFLLGSGGTLVELLLLDHLESWTQWIPVVLFGAGIVLGLWSARTDRYGPLMLAGALYVVAGAVGIYLHLDGNRAFELEMYPDLTGLSLLAETVTGATPALAPGTMIQIGLLALVIAWPALWPSPTKEPNP